MYIEKTPAKFSGSFMKILNKKSRGELKKMKINKLTNYIAIMCFTLLLGATAFAQAPNCTNVTFTAGMNTSSENFDTLANTGTSSTVPGAFGFAEAGTGANTTYSAGTGSATGGDTYSFGAAADTDRAFGGLQSGSLIPTVGACFTNNTGAAINSFTITYDGEQWRLGATGRTDRLDFQYSTDATSLTVGTYTDVDALDFTAPITTAPTGALNGNAAANRTAGITSMVTPVTIANGATFYIRWLDFNATGADDGLGIDNFSISVAPALAGEVSVGGRVMDNRGFPIANATVMLSGGPLTQPRTFTTGGFGFFEFRNVSVGSTYVVSVMSGGFSFEQPAQVITLNDEQNGLLFVGTRFFGAPSKRK